MSALSGKIRSAEGGRLLFWCPGCDSAHQVSIGEGTGPRWGYNGNPNRPTFTPSVLVTYNGAEADAEGGIPAICHSFVVDGQIQFLGDCTHHLANQTVEIPDWERA